MKNSFLIKCLVFLSVLSTSIQMHAQSWQWGKRGGSTNQLIVYGSDRPEEVYDIVTDSNKNIYVLSTVGKTGLNIDNVPKTNYGDNTTLIDVAIASFTCEGTYRWSKIIGGGGIDRVNSIQIDSEDNIYVCGKFGSCTDVTYPPRIENDIIILQNPSDCSLIFLAKFNSNGDMLWFKRPQEAGVPSSIGNSQTASYGLQNDEMGNLYWLVALPEGVYADGAFTTTLPGSQPGSPYYILKYDDEGNFISGNHIDMQLTYTFAGNVKFYRNHYNNKFYFTSIKSATSATAVVGGQTITHTAFIACFNSQGQFEWVREDTATSPGSIDLFDIEFDEQSNIYLSGRLLGFNFNNFLGLIIPGMNAPSFVMKVNPTAETLLWSSYHNKGSLQRGAIALNGNELGFTNYGYGTDFTWGDQVLNVNPGGTGTDVIFARFNKDTGTCIGLSKIPGDAGYDDAGTALAVDASGDYILGGFCGHQLTFATNTITGDGGQGDFFVAKYSTAPCTPLANEEFNEQGLELYPNPTTNLITITVKEDVLYHIYTLTGAIVQSGSLGTQNQTIDVSALSKGCYLIQTTDNNGVKRSGKIIKQ